MSWKIDARLLNLITSIINPAYLMPIPPQNKFIYTRPIIQKRSKIGTRARQKAWFLTQ